MKNVTDSAKVSESTEIDPSAKYDEFFTKDNIEISVMSIYRNANVTGTADRMALLTQLKEIAKARGYNVSESESGFTRTKYIRFKKYRLQAETPPPPPPLKLNDEVIVDVDQVRPPIGP